MDRLDLMAVFVAVAEEQSFVGGARRLDMSPPAVTRAIASLEERLKIRLLIRTTRYVRVTEAGQRYLEDARRIISEVDAADEAVAGISGVPKGHLAITAPVLFGKLFVMPGIVEYLGRYPDMEVSAVFLDRIVNIFATSGTSEYRSRHVRCRHRPAAKMQFFGGFFLCPLLF